MEMENKLVKKHPKKVVVKEINVLEGLHAWKAREFCVEAGFEGKSIIKMASLACKLYKCYKGNDMKMVEINPVIEDKEGDFYAADAVIVLDDDGMKRHNFEFKEKVGLREKTPREIAANAIDKEDYRGVAGRTFIEMGGNIGILSSGGGASITAMDALITFGAKMANYTEYSGNPPPEKSR